jgi:hypothetical protein
MYALDIITAQLVSAILIAYLHSALLAFNTSTKRLSKISSSPLKAFPTSAPPHPTIKIFAPIESSVGPAITLLASASNV